MLDRTISKAVNEEIRKNNRQKIGMHAFVTLDGFIFEMVIKDYKQVFGQDIFLVSPISYGTGEKWIKKIDIIYP